MKEIARKDIHLHDKLQQLSELTNITFSEAFKALKLAELLRGFGISKAHVIKAAKAFELLLSMLFREKISITTWIQNIRNTVSQITYYHILNTTTSVIVSQTFKTH